MKIEMNYFKDSGEFIGSNKLELRPNPNQEVQEQCLMEGDTATVLFPPVKLNFILPEPKPEDKICPRCGLLYSPGCCDQEPIGWDEW